MSGGAGYEYSVEHGGDSKLVEIALVRRAAKHGWRARLGLGRLGEPMVLSRRWFEANTQRDELERYADELRELADYANAGKWGCFVDIGSHEGLVRITLYERWFDGRRLRCEVLAQREFDAGDDATLVTSTEFATQLQVWAERRNEQRDADYAESSAANVSGAKRAIERDAAADELTAILSNRRGHPHPRHSSD